MKKSQLIKALQAIDGDPVVIIGTSHDLPYYSVDYDPVETITKCYGVASEWWRHRSPSSDNDLVTALLLE